MVVEILVLILIVIAIFLVLVFNSLISSRNKVKNSFAQIDVQLKKRADTIVNLVEIVKGYAKHEKSLFEEVTAARASVASASPQEVVAASNALTKSAKSLFAVAENYPDLKANENFLKLQEQLVRIENDIAYARMVYNDVVTIFNTKIQSFPNNVIAPLFGFSEQKLLETNEIERAAAKVNI
jgi:LemA protein